MKVRREKVDKTAGWLYILTAYGLSLSVLSMSLTDAPKMPMLLLALATIACVFHGRRLIRKGRV